MLDFSIVVPNLVVLIDLLDTRSYTDSQQASLNSMLCHCFTFRSIVAHSSGSGSFLPPRSIAHRFLSQYKKTFPKVNYVPFDDTQAYIFLRETPPKSDVVPTIELKGLTGFNQSLMASYVHANKKSDLKQLVMSEVNSFINSVVPTLRDDNYFWVKENLPICLKFFYYATNEFEIPIRDMDGYICSWINTESITYLKKLLRHSNLQ